jgi:rare lipoprotein A
MLATKFKSLLLATVLPALTLLGANPASAQSCGYASHYGVGDGYNGQRTASGERFNTYDLTAAHPYLPMGTRLRVTRGNNSVTVRINDRGPYYGGRELDLSYAAFSRLASPSRGEIRVCYARA